MVKQFSEEEIAKIAFSHEPNNMESTEGRQMLIQALKKIIPVYDETQMLSESVAKNNAMEIKALISNVDTDTLLICFKAFAYSIKKGDNCQILGSAQKWIMETLKGRNLSTIQTEKTEDKKPENKNIEEKKQKNNEQKPKNNEKKQDKVNKPSKSKKGMILGCIVLVLILGIGGFFGIKFLKKQQSQGQQETLQEGNLGDKMIIELYPTAEISDKELEDSFKIIDERVKVLGIDYTIDHDETKITITLDKNFTSDSKEKEYIIDLIRTKGDFDISLQGFEVISDCNEKIESIETDTETADKFKRLYCDDFFDFTTESIIAEEDTEVKYINVKLNAETALEFKAADEKFTTDCFDAQADTKASFAAIGGGYQASFTEMGKIILLKDTNYKEFILVQESDVRCDKGLELLEYIIKGEKLACQFEMEIIQDPEWETDESKFGENQVADVGGEYIEVLYKRVLGSDVAENDEKAIQSFKKKADFIGTPYAIGYTGFANENLVLRMSPSSINYEILRLLIGGREIDIYSQFDKLYSVTDIEVNKNESGNLSLEAKMSATKDEIFTKYTEQVGSVEGQNLYLVVNDVTIAEAKLADVTDDSKITFSNLLCFELQTISDEEYWLLELIEALKNNTYTGSMKECDEIEIRYFKDGKFVTEKMNSIPWGYPGSRIEHKILKAAESNGADVTKSYAKRNTIIFELGIKTDLSFAENFLKAVEQIYTECNFDDGSYAQVVFKNKDAENKNPADIAKVEFIKREGEMYINAYFEGPSYKKYQESVKAYAQASPFYTKPTPVAEAEGSGEEVAENVETTQNTDKPNNSGRTEKKESSTPKNTPSNTSSSTPSSQPAAPQNSNTTEIELPKDSGQAPAAIPYYE